MINGSISMSSGKAWKGRIDWDAESNLEGNFSIVNATVTTWKTDGYVTSGSGNFVGYLDIGGVDSVAINYAQQEKGQQVVARRYNVKVPHNDDGKKKITIAAAITKEGGTSLGGATLSGSEVIKLEDIPRYAKLTSVPNFTDEENPVIGFDNPAGKAAKFLRFNISSEKVPNNSFSIWRDDADKTASSYQFVFTQAERDLIYKASANKNSINVRVYLGTSFTTKEDTKYTSVVKTLSIVNAQPTLSPTIVDTNPKAIEYTGDANTLINAISDAKFDDGAIGIKGASIVSHLVRCGKAKLDIGAGTISSVDSGDFGFSVVDTRGNTSQVSIKKPFVEYVPLTCNLDSSAELMTETTAKIHIKASGNYFNNTFGAKPNFLKVWYRFKKQGEQEFSQWLPMQPSISGNRYNATVDLPDINYQDAYVVQVSAADAFHDDLRSPEKVIKALPVFDWSGEDFNFNVPVNFSKGATGLGGQDIEQINQSVTELQTSMNAVKPKVDAINDYIIASGYDGGWTWRKWNNGWAEGWYYQTFDLPCDSNWGNVKSSSANFIAPIPYPFTFKWTPCVTIGFENINGDYWIATHNPKGTTSATPAYQAIRGTAYSSLQVRIHIHVCGDWK